MPRQIPKQDIGLVQLLAERYMRASEGMQPWAERAKECVEMTEANRDGQRTQWTAAALKKLNDEDRPAFSFNKIRPLVRMVLGYQANNRTDSKFLPGHDGTGTEAVAAALTHLAKHTAEFNQEQYVDGEVMMDGIITGRAYYDARLDQQRNVLGDLVICAKDPFSIKVDPDLEDYDLNKGAFVMEDRWVSVDEIAFWYGRSAELLLSPIVSRSGQAGMPSNAFMEWVDEVAPWRGFGGTRGNSGPLLGVHDYFMQSYDPYRKSIRLVDCQHYIRVMTRVLYDLETGIFEPIPEDWDDEKIKKVLDFADDWYGRKGKLSPIRFRVMPMRRVRWTTLASDIIVYDAWSRYESFTLTGYFPWFRRGQTQGMVDDLIDPQNEVNKRRSANIDIVTRASNSGWKYHKDSLTEENKERLENYGAAPGFNMEWQGEVEPKRIEPSAPPVGMERLEQKANDDLHEISGVNRDLAGMEDSVTSGRAILARQRQGVVSIQTYIDNHRRTKELLARKKLEIYQNHYTEQRIITTLGDDGRLISTKINERAEAAARIVNDITVGTYRVVIDDTPMSASFLSAQFDEIMTLIEKGVLPAIAFGDIAIDASSLGRKDEIKQRWQQLQGAMAAPAAPPGGVPAEGGAPPALPPGAEPMPDAQVL